MQPPLRLQAGQRVRVIAGRMHGPGVIVADPGAPYRGALGAWCWPVQLDGVPADLPVLVAEADLVPESAPPDGQGTA